MAWAWDKDIPPTEKFVLIAISDCANEGRNYECWPSITHIAKKTSLHRTTAMRSIEYLIERGLMEKIESPGKANMYKILVDFTAKKPSKPVAQSDQSQKATSSRERPTSRTERPELVAESDTNRNRTVKKRNSPLSPDFELTEKMKDFAKSKEIGNVQEEFEHFCSHHISKGSMRIDWEATWRTWCLQSKKWAKPKPNTDDDDWDPMQGAI